MELDMEQSATEVRGAFYNLPGLLLNGFGRLGLGWFNSHFQHRENLWSAEGFGCARSADWSCQQCAGQSASCLFIPLSPGQECPPRHEAMRFAEIIKSRPIFADPVMNALHLLIESSPEVEGLPGVFNPVIVSRLILLSDPSLSQG